MRILNREENQEVELVDHRRSITNLAWFEIGRSGLGHILLDIVMVNVVVSGWTVLIRMTSPTSYTTLFNRFYGAELGLVLSIEINARTMSLSSDNINEDCLGWKSLYSFLATTALFLTDGICNDRVDAILKTHDEGIP
ncbi:hypothetical protein Tco_0576203 [Tanacetum coccineum]